MILLVDSDVLIEVLRGSSVVSDQLKTFHLSGHVLSYSPVTRAELRYGLRPGEETRVAGLLDRLVCIEIDGEIGEKAGEYLAKYRESHGVQLGDALIAASVFRSRSALVTLNRKHYPMPDILFHDLARVATP